MEKLKSYLISRMLFVLVAILAAEAGMVFLVRHVLLAYAARIAEYSPAAGTLGTADVIPILIGVFSGRAVSVFLDIVRKSTAVGAILLSVVLVILPVLVGVLLYSRIAVRQVDRLEKEREAERKAFDARRNLMLSDFAHDLRTPVMTISGYAGALSDGLVKEPEKQAEYLTAIRTKADRMGSLINLLFDYTKLGSVNYSLEKEETDLNELLREAAASVFDEVENAEMELLPEIPEEAYTVQADRAQTARVFHNLLANAVKHNPAGTKIAVVVKRRAGIEYIAFADSGVRIEKDAAELFEPFVRGDSARKGDGGSGLGLSIAKRITEMHGWELTLEQPYGEYTKAFVIAVPER